MIRRLALLALVLAPFCSARTETRTIRWSELPAAVGQETVTLVLRDGNRLQGRVAGQQPDALLFDILKSSDKRAYAPGQRSIPRTEVAEVRLKQFRGPWRAIFASGAGTGMFCAALPWAISDSRINVSDGTRITQLAFITAGAVTAGYLAGRQADARQTILRFAPGSE
jgi:hypothetical protein